MIDGRGFFDQPVKNDLRTYDNIWKNSYWSRWWLHNWLFTRLSLFKKYYKLTAIELNKQQKLDAGPKAIQQTNFNGNLDRDGSTQMFFITEEAKKAVLGFLKGTVEVLWFYFGLI